MGSQQTFTVKLLSKGLPEVARRLWRRQLPADATDLGGVNFVFDPEHQAYDWLVVYDDLPMQRGQKHSRYIETLRCDPRNTVLVTAEPSSIKLYSSDFTRQFAWVLSTQERWAIRHPNHVRVQAGLRWFYGHGRDHILSYEAIAQHVPVSKSDRISVVCSSKAHRHTLHHQRVQFIQQLQQRISGLEVFGHGVRPLDDKAEAIDSYRYHIAIENHVAQHHWTEKLSDTFLGGALPFYCGAPNAADYFPAESFIPIDIAKPDEASEIIHQAIASDQYTKRLPAILEARRRVLEKHQLFAFLTRLVQRLSLSHGYTPTPGELIVSRRLARQGVGPALRYFGQQALTRTRGSVATRRSSGSRAA